MKTGGRKLLRHVAGILTVLVLMSAAYTTTAMASGIGLIDTADLLDIHATADDSSEIVGQVMDEGRVVILGRADGWVQIQAGDIIGWIPENNLIETEDSCEEAYAANQEVIAELAEEAKEAEGTEETQQDAEQEEAGSEAFSETDANGEQAVADNSAVQVTPAEDAAAFVEQAQDEAAEAVQEAQRQTEEAAQEAQRQAEEAAQEAQRQAEAVAQEAQRQAEAAAQEAQRQAEAAAQEAQRQAELAAQEAQQASGYPVTDEELYLLANLIYCEAGSEPYVGKVAVGSVVLNRVESDRQPDTITDVVYAKGQFSPVRNGSLSRALANGSADESCYQAAMEALAGSKPVGDKLFFRRINGRSGQVIGHHVFY